MKKRVKVFESGTYTQGEYPADKVKKIFEKSKGDIKAIYAHTSKWLNSGKKPIELGEFHNFQTVNDGDKLKVFADISLNKKGKDYYNDGIFQGISVELPEDNLTKIALLPIGVNPAVAGAEFQSDDAFYFEFEEIEMEEEMTLEKVMERTKEFSAGDRIKVLNSILSDISEKNKTEFESQVNWDKIQVLKPDENRKNEFEGMTPDEFAKAVEKRISVKTSAMTKAKEFMENNKLKITPAMKEAGLTEEFMQSLFSSGPNTEFEEKNFNVIEILEKTFDKMPEVIKPGKEMNGKEFGGTEFSEEEKAYQDGANLMKTLEG